MSLLMIQNAIQTYQQFFRYTRVAKSFYLPGNNFSLYKLPAKRHVNINHFLYLVLLVIWNMKCLYIYFFKICIILVYMKWNIIVISNLNNNYHVKRVNLWHKNGLMIFFHFTASNFLQNFWPSWIPVPMVPSVFATLLKAAHIYACYHKTHIFVQP